MRSACRLVIAGFVTIFTTVAPRAALSQSPPALAAACTGSWEVVPTLNLGPGDNVLSAVDADSTTDAWAVGYHLDANGQRQTLIEHWDGTSWTLSPSPGGQTSSSLSGVSALASDDAWAAGYVVGQGGSSRTLVEHWDGTSWSVVASPNPGSGDALVSISVDPSNDGWAVGSRGGNRHPLLLRWDGVTWTVDPSIPVLFNHHAKRVHLVSVSSYSTTSAWIVGNSRGTRLVALFWNGTGWAQAGTDRRKGSLTSVSAFGETEAFGAGGKAGVGFIEHWSGGGVGGTTLGDQVAATFVSVSAVSSTDGWAVAPVDSAHRVGTHWHEVPVAAPTGTESLQGVAEVEGAAFAVGSYVNLGIPQTLAEMIC